MPVWRRWLFLLIPALLISSLAGAAEVAPFSDEVRLQIEELQAEKEARTPAQQKMESQLVLAAKRQRHAPFTARAAAVVQKTVKVAADGAALVDITANVTPELLTALKTAGATIVDSVPRFRAVRARVPLAAIEGVAARADVSFIKNAVKAYTHTGSINSEGDLAHGTGGATGARATYNVSGAGVKVGIISDSADYLAKSQASGDLGPVTVLQDSPGETGEGTAMLEIVHDLAPAADLFFATAYISEAGFAQNILNLRAAGCDIIADDVGYFDESPFQNGPIAEAVEQVTADGALCFSAAGNEGSKNRGTSGTWEGDFADGGATTTPITKAGRLHSFGALNYDIVTSVGFGETLFWSDPRGASTNDYDLYVLNSTGTSILAFSNNTQNGSQDPVELIVQGEQPISAGNRLVVVKAASAAPRYLQVATLRGTLSTSTSGKVSGHSGCPSVISMAAVSAAFATPFNTSSRVETFSSDGPRRMFFNTDGTPMTPGNFSSTGGRVFQKPDLAAADGVSTSVPGFTPFYGTSAAAPHAAAIAALLKSQNLKMTPQQLRAAVFSNTIDIEGAGVDRDTGYGIIQPGPTLLATTPGAKIEQASLTITAESYTPADNAPDPGERLTVALALRNSGGTATGNLTATLLPTGGVTNPTMAQIYNLPIGQTDTQTFSFNANASSSARLTLSFLLMDGATSYGTLTQSWQLGTLAAARVFNNPTSITINDYTGTPPAAAATPYPAAIAVTGVTGEVGKVTARLNGFSHTFPGDVKVMLISPSGTRVMLVAYGGGDADAVSTDLTFDDDGSTNYTPSRSGTYHPIDFSNGGQFGDPFPAPVPSGTFFTQMSAFSGEAPNGSWSLYVVDDGPGDVGSISGGWTLSISPVTFSNPAAAGPDLSLSMAASANTGLIAGQSVVYTMTIYNNGTTSASGVQLVDTLPSGFLTLTGNTVSQGTGTASGNKLTANLGTIAAKGSATVTLTALAALPGSFNNTATVTTTGNDTDTSNNSATQPGFIGSPNLTLVQPSGWSDKLVVSNVPGTNTDSGNPGDPLYLDFAVGNSGTATAPAYFSTKLFVDGILVRTIDRQLALPAGGVYRVEDVLLPPLTAGLHTVRVLTDSAGIVTESNETDNDYSRVVGTVTPTISALADASMLEDGTPAQISFTVGDAMSGADALTLSATSSITAIVPNGGIVFSGSGASRSMTITPVPNANGPTVITVTATATDGRKGTGTLNFTVTPVNDAPTLDALPNLTILEDIGAQPVTLTGISAGGGETQNLTVTATSNNSALIPNPQIIYTSPQATARLNYKSQQDRFGTATITVTVTDNGVTANGGINTTSRSFDINVANVNDPPTLDAIGDLTVLEGAGPQPVTLTGISAGPFENDPLTITAVSNDPQLVPNPQIAYVAGAATAQLTFTPQSDVVHTATITVTVDDGQGQNSKAVQTFKINVTPVNDAPSFVKGNDLSAFAGAGDQRAQWATQISPGPADEAGQQINFLVSVDRPALFTKLPAISSDGMLTFTPAPDVSGIATVTVQLHDDGGTDNGGHDTSPAQSFLITISAVNHAPSFIVGANQQLLQNAGAQAIAGWATGISAGPAGEEGQTLDFSVTLDQPELFTTPPVVAADGTLSFTPAPNQSGTAQVTVRLHDNGGTNNGGDDTSAPQMFTITIGAINDPPSFTKGPNQSTAQNAGAQSSPHWATSVLAGPSDESSQQVTFEVTTPDTQLFKVAPAISPDGTLTYTPDPKGSGTATVTVILHDDGGTANGGKDAGAPQIFTIAVTTYLEETGTYNGLVAAPAGQTPTHASAGLIRVAVTRTGAFTAVLRLGGLPYVVRGQFDNAGVGTFGRKKLPAQTLARRNLPELSLKLSLDVANGTDQLTGTVTDGSATFATLVADRALYTVPKLAKPPLRAVSADILGPYTVLFPAKTPAAQLRSAETYPQGDGVATLAVNTRGQAILRAILPDGTRVSYVNSLSKANMLPVYLPLSRGAGSLSGVVTFRDRQDMSDLDGLDLNWFKPASRAKLYPLGWMDGLKIDLIGSRYLAKPAQSTLSPLIASNTAGNVEAAFTGGSLAAPGLVQPFNLDARDLAHPLAGGASPFALRLTRANGLIAGRFTNPATHHQLPFYGVVFQKQAVASGYFLDTTETGSFVLTPATAIAGGTP